ncbi:MAG: hypothetical protein AB7P69_06320 [Candidatus Binatia bacterium]
MAKMKISDGPRYQKTGSPSQKKAHKLAEIMTLIIKDALSSVDRKIDRQVVTSSSPREGA